MKVSELKKWIRYDAESGKFFWLKNTGRGRIGQEAGTLMNKGYIAISIQGNHFLAHRLAWLFVYGKLPKHFIDHKDHNKTNNRICNLREATPAQSQANRLTQKNNSSGFIGVAKTANGLRWRAYISVNRKTKYLGTYDTPKSAAIARDYFAKQIHKSFATLNFPQPS